MQNASQSHLSRRIRLVDGERLASTRALRPVVRHESQRTSRLLQRLTAAFDRQIVALAGVV